MHPRHPLRRRCPYGSPARRGRRLARHRHGRPSPGRHGHAPELRRARIRHHLPPADRRAGRRSRPVPHPRRAAHARAAHRRADPRPGGPGYGRALRAASRLSAPAAAGRGPRSRPQRRPRASGHGCLQPVFLRPAAGSAAGPGSPLCGTGRTKGRVLALCGPDPALPGRFRHPLQRGDPRARRPVAAPARRRLARPAYRPPRRPAYHRAARHLPCGQLSGGRRLVRGLLPAGRRGPGQPPGPWAAAPCVWTA